MTDKMTKDSPAAVKGIIWNNHHISLHLWSLNNKADKITNSNYLPVFVVILIQFNLLKVFRNSE